MTHGPYFHVTQNEKEMCEECGARERPFLHEDWDVGYDTPLMKLHRMQAALHRIHEVLAPADNANNVETVGRAREIALAALSR